jgi:hypothetical protein
MWLSGHIPAAKVQKMGTNVTRNHHRSNT